MNEDGTGLVMNFLKKFSVIKIAYLKLCKMCKNFLPNLITSETDSLTLLALLYRICTQNGKVSVTFFTHKEGLNNKMIAMYKCNVIQLRSITITHLYSHTPLTFVFPNMCNDD